VIHKVYLLCAERVHTQPPPNGRRPDTRHTDDIVLNTIMDRVTYSARCCGPHSEYSGMANTSAPTRPREARPTQLGSNACCSYFTPSSAAGSHLTANASGRSSTKYAATDRHRLVRLQVSREAAACSHRATLMLGAATATSRAPNIFKTPRHDRIRPETHQSLATASAAASHNRPNRAVCEPCAIGSTL
jgi:hypothetical protein